MVVGIIGIIATITIRAINPTLQLESGHNAKRNQDTNQLQKAMYQYLIDNNEFAGNKEIPEGKSNAIAICKQGILDSSCVNIDDLVPEYVSAIPADSTETSENLTGYWAYKKSGAVKVYAIHFGDSPWAGLVLHWTFDEAAENTCSGGEDACDAGIYGNHGTWSGPMIITEPQWTTAVPSAISATSTHALSLDGFDDHVHIGDLSSYFADEKATFCTWIRLKVHTPSHLDDDETGSWSFNNSDGYNHYPWEDGNIYDGTFKTVRETVGTGIVADRTQWHHVCITREAGPNGWNFYQNGTLVHTADGGIWDLASTIKVGESNSIYNINGHIDDVRLYNRILSADTIASIAAGN